MSVHRAMRSMELSIVKSQFKILSSYVKGWSLLPVIAISMWAVASDTDPQNKTPNIAHLVLVAGSDELGKDSVEQRLDPMPGASTTMTKTQAGCQSQADVDRLIQFAEAKDGHGIATFLAQRIAANECVILMLGDRVRINATADLSNRVCVLPQGHRTCFWTLSNGVDLKPKVYP
jgi:hypothetical protein